ncbi:ABC transporter substrate-binding protein [Usitatibacter palustris]|uniref:Heme-binding protein A n=1 Tax=Usitatibacter palustris TaxID=2732487 RepID=A0A6M4HBD6_9PROT|nr:ABC transporter substrate-binding protein [Usitatibacter palustris]QJR16168.1 Heme-binding protein A [Usitatibacter palustris]
MLNRTALGAAVLATLFALAADAKTLRWSSQGDILTMDPHAQNEGLNNSVSDHVYEPLVTRGKDLKIEPCLALSWKAEGTSAMRFKLRPNVKFHDGAPFTADDVVFSVERALAPTSNFSPYMQGITGAKKIDDLTVDITTSGPNPVLLAQLTEVRMVNRAWAVKNNVVRPQDFKNKEETYGARNANGTGPYVLKSREPDVKTVMVLNSNWWGKMEGNVNEIVYTPIKSDGTRIAALLSGELDFILDPPVQDIPRLKSDGKIRILEGNENRTIFFGFDQWRDELTYSSVKGKNPFKDQRVREAFQLALDLEAIKTQVMRGLAFPTGVMFAPQVDGYDKSIDIVKKPNPERAKKLLADAGYPNGFEVTMDCPNNRYINDEKICQAAAAMLARINIKIKLNAMPRATYFPKIQNFDTSLYMLGWGVPTFDSLYALQSLLRTNALKGGDGNFNLGKYSNPKVDAAVDALKTEVDPVKRKALAKEVLTIHAADVGHIPLHHQVIPWAMRSGVSAVHRADNRLTVKWVKIQ